MERDSGPVVEDWTTHESVAAAVVSALAQAENVEPDGLDPLYEIVDPDALGMLFTTPVPPTQNDRKRSFTVDGCKVIIYGDGRVVVAPASATTSSEHRR